MTEHDRQRAKRFVDWFIRSPFADARRFGSNDDWIADPERMERCERAAEHGAEGSTHAEIIEDWRKAFADFVRYGGKRNTWSAGYARFDAIVSAYFEDLEAWHEANGTLHEEVG
jgi:hypothetical protein